MCQCDGFCECSSGVGCIKAVDVFLIFTERTHVFCHELALMAPGLMLERAFK